MSVILATARNTLGATIGMGNAAGSAGSHYGGVFAMFAGRARRVTGWHGWSDTRVRAVYQLNADRSPPLLQITLRTPNYPLKQQRRMSEVLVFVVWEKEMNSFLGFGVSFTNQMPAYRKLNVHSSSILRKLPFYFDDIYVFKI
ncbi:MAG: hypothetical protein F4120_12665 [Rhodothermaceae bacterium]|nr:hypothetical protein [Rhodothermaceae bacterium]MYI18449.1 hypothetical protein [Rhodothermaceae bacterium]